MNTLTAEFFRDIEAIQNHSEDMEEALERLVESPVFSRIAVFFGDSWIELCYQASRMGKTIFSNNPNQYHALLRPAIFLVLCELSQEGWDRLRAEDDYCTEYDYCYDCETYVSLCNKIRREIEKDLLDGVTLRQHSGREEDAWPTEENDPSEPDQDAFIDEEVDVEDEALNNILLDKIRGMVNDEEWDIITAEHGDGPELAKRYGVSVEVIWKRRERLISYLREELGSDY